MKSPNGTWNTVHVPHASRGPLVTWSADTNQWTKHSKPAQTLRSHKYQVPSAPPPYSFRKYAAHRTNPTIRDLVSLTSDKDVTSGQNIKQRHVILSHKDVIRSPIRTSDGRMRPNLTWPPVLTQTHKATNRNCHSFSRQALCYVTTDWRTLQLNCQTITGRGKRRASSPQRLTSLGPSQRPSERTLARGSEGTQRHRSSDGTKDTENHTSIPPYTFMMLCLLT